MAAGWIATGLVASTVAAALAGTGSSVATPLPEVPSLGPPVVLCETSDKRLSELSGLATDGGPGRWAISDGGSRVRVYELGPDCAVRATRTAPLDPDDLEDLARTDDGTLWLADTGDNDRDRHTVAVLALTLTGRITRYSLRYPDGPHDVEAILLTGRDRTPLLVTKELFGPAKVYRPERALEPALAGQVLALRKVAEVALPGSDTTGGPIGGFGSRTITGGATTADGTVLALRTYTDAWLYAAPDGDLVAALGRVPVRIPLPGEPQGEAIAFDVDGGLLSGSERRAGVVGQLRVVPGAVARSTTVPDLVAAPGPARPGPGWLHRGVVELAALVALVTGLGIGLVVLRRRRARSERSSGRRDAAPVAASADTATRSP